MKKKMIANIVMVAIIVVIAVVGILAVGHIQGWFDADDGSFAVLTQLRGIVTMERDDVAYTADSETVLRRGDKISCGSGATSVIRIGEGCLTLGEKAEAVIEDPSTANFSATVTGGEVFINTFDSLSLSFDGKTVVFSNTVAALSVRSGAQSVSVFEGTVEDAPAGQVIDWIGETVSVSQLRLSTLNDFTMARIRSANESKTLCFSNDDLDALVAQREEEMQAMLNAAATTEPEEITTPAEPTAETTEPVEETTEATQPSESTSAENTSAPTPPAEKETEPTRPAEKETEPATEPTATPMDEPTTAPTEEPTTVAATEPSTEPASEPSTTPTEEPTMVPTEAPTEPKNTCTITIRCDTILSNMDNLDPAKAGFVPSSGCILSTKTVEFTEGETVFDVLKRVCSAYGIQLEYSWTPMYDSYYIEGINNLYEFDCGSESGWMYKVNGWFPNYGCSSYTLKEGDSIVWCYTCVGLGADVGA